MYKISKHIFNQIVKKALKIREAIWLGFKPFFLFDKTKNYSIYKSNIFQILPINK